MLRAENISKSFIDHSTGKRFELLDNVSLHIAPGEAVALMGGSGSGKSTLARILLRLLPCDSGEIYFHDTGITKASGKKLYSFRRAVQFISQRPESFLDPGKSLGYSLREGLEIFSLSRDDDRILELLDLVKLNKELLMRYPHQVSGGEIQRLCLVRALLLEPELLILDEPTSMLDISVQAQIMHLLKDIRRQRQLAYLLISHDRLISEWLCDRVLYLEKGRLE